MWINTFYSSLSPVCGTYIFNKHLGEALSHVGIFTLPHNIRTSHQSVPPLFSVVHYVPSGFVGERTSRAFSRLLNEIPQGINLCIIVHGVHSFGETRFRKDGVSQNQEHHVRIMCHSARSIIALSHSAANNWRTWQARFGGEVSVVEIPHPGLFRVPEITAHHNSYALVGGISRPKKDHASESMDRLMRLCERKGIKIWQHWTNMTETSGAPLSWRRSFGVVSDAEWSNRIANAKVVLCPYETEVQTVSGVISEAISANRFVLATSFDAALEMQQKTPQLVRIEDDLDRWPDLICALPLSPGEGRGVVPTWNSFAKTLVGQILNPSLGVIPTCTSTKPVAA